MIGNQKRSTVDTKRYQAPAEIRPIPAARPPAYNINATPIPTRPCKTGNTVESTNPRRKLILYDSVFTAENSPYIAPSWRKFFATLIPVMASCIAELTLAIALVPCLVTLRAIFLHPLTK